MRIEDILRNPLDRAHSAPASPVSQTQRRSNAANPNMPAPGEDFAAYYNRRRGDLSAVADAVDGPRSVSRNGSASATATTVRGASIRPPAATVGQIVARGFQQRFNDPGMDLQRIPMGVGAAFPRLSEKGGSPLPTEGRGEYAVSTTFDAEGRPVSLRTAPLDWSSPARRFGVITWGVDLRRPEADVFGDVERAAGAPDGLLNMISMRESDLRGGRRQYDQGGPDSTSAQGPHQFTVGTFLTWLKGTGEAYGIPVQMMDDQERRDLRFDARVSGAMTAESARFYYNRMREMQPGAPAPSIADMYLAHHGGEEALPLIRDVHAGNGDRPAAGYYNEAAVRNHPNDYFVGGVGGRARTAREFYDWMTGNDPNSPHRRNYHGRGLEGLPTDPVEFRPRADGSHNPARVVRPGVILLDPPADPLRQ